MYDEVLVTTDGSAAAQRAFEHAVALAELYDARLHALYVVEVGTPPLGIDRTGLWNDVVEDVRERGEAFTDRVVDAAREAEVDAVQAIEEHDTPVEGVLGYVKEHGIDAVVMGTHGRSGPRRWLLGSVAERVLRGSPVPVLAVPPPDADDG